MRPSKQSHGAQDLFRERLDAIIDLDHPLARLAGLVPWRDFAASFGRLYEAVGRPAKPTRLMVGLHDLEHSCDLSDEEAVAGWVENPYRMLRPGDRDIDCVWRPFDWCPFDCRRAALRRF